MSPGMSMFEDFSKDLERPSEMEGLASETEEYQNIRLAAFEEGYRAGWDDALKAQNGAETDVLNALSQNLQDLSFTYNEAISHAMIGLRGVLFQMVEQFLPEVAKAQIAPQVAAHLESLPDTLVRSGVELEVHPDVSRLLEDLMAHDFGFPISLRVSSELQPAEARLTFSHEETEIDLSAVLSGIRELLSGFEYEQKKETRYGT